MRSASTAVPPCRPSRSFYSRSRSTTACSPAVTSADSTPAPAQTSTQPKAEPAASLHIYIDWSGSLVRPALEEAWNTIKEELPRIAEHYRVRSLEISRFDEDGWCPERLIEIQLPIFTEPARVKLASSEWDSFCQHPRRRPEF
jgi:hypothetical protein